MALAIDQLLLAGGLLLLFAIFASKASGRSGFPALLVFLLIGILAGSEGLGGIEFSDPDIAQSLGVVALTFILFAGGLDTKWKSIRPVLWAGLSLSTLAVLVTAASVGLFAMWLLDLSFLEGLLLGAIVSSTDAAAVFSVMRSRGLGLTARIKRILELESGSNDPMAVFLTVGLITLILNPGMSMFAMLPMFAQQMLLGAMIGMGMGWLAVPIINRIRLTHDGLYSVLTLAIAVTVYALAAVTGGNGFLAVYLAGLMMGARDFIHKRSIVRFHDGLAWLMQIAMFISLGLLVFPSQLVPVASVGLLLSLFLIFIARPLGVFTALLPFRLSVRERGMISWVGLRGAVPIILATYPLVVNVPNAELIFNVVFFIVLTSVALQGPLLPYMAQWLGVAEFTPDSRRYPIELEQTADLDSDLAEVPVPANSPVIGKKIVDLSLPSDALVILVSREDKFIVPRGDTVLRDRDRLLVLAKKTSFEDVKARLSGGDRVPAG